MNAKKPTPKKVPPKGSMRTSVVRKPEPSLLTRIGGPKVLVSAILIVVALFAIATFMTGNKQSATSVASTTLVPCVPGSAVQVQELPLLPEKGPDPAVCLKAPALSGKNFKGEPVSFTPGDGKAKLVVLVAHWCPHCKREVPKIVKWLADGTIPASIETIAISTGVQKEAPNYPPSAWFEKEKWTQPIFDDVDGSLGKTYGLSGFPYLVLINTDGTIASRRSGEATQKEIVAFLKAAKL
jgi:cytochrome c biogenesis protein CcmG, thiol:disulfide interchange protein DsbE